MLDRARGALLWSGAVLLWTVPVLSGDTAAGMRAFRKGDYPTAYREWKADANQGQRQAARAPNSGYERTAGVFSLIRQQAFRRRAWQPAW